MILKLRSVCAAVMLSLALIGLLSPSAARAQATALPSGKQCFQATTGISGFVGLLGTIVPGSGGTVNGTFGGVALTGGSGTLATANITVAGGKVTAVAILDPGGAYIVGDVLSAASASIGNVTGFSVPVASTSINSSLAGGSVGMYVPSTLTPSQTWQNAAQTAVNTNPIALDANGCALIFGIGTYRQILYDSLGNEVWDQLTQVAPVNPYWAALATGTANVITVNDPSFSSTDGQAITFIAAFTNTGATTINGIVVEKNSSSGPEALTGGEIVAGNVVTIYYSANSNVFLLENYPVNAGNTLNGIYGIIYPMNSPYNCAGDGTTDDTACLNAAIAAAANSILYLGAHVYKVSSELTPAAPFQLQGSNAAWPNVCASGIKAGVSDMNLISLPEGSLVNNVCFEMNAGGVNTSGTAVITDAGSTKIYNSYIDSACIGIDVSGNTSFISNVYIGNDGGGGACSGIIVGRTTTNAFTVDLGIVNVTVQGNQTNPPGTDQLILDAGGLYENGDNLLYGTIGTLMQPGVNQQITWTFISNTALGDTTVAQGMVINPADPSSVISGVFMNGSWTSSAAAGDEIVLENTGSGVLDGVDFEGHRALNIGNGNGLDIIGGTNITFNAGAICGYRTGTSGVAIGSGSSHVKVTNATIGIGCLNAGGPYVGATTIGVNSASSNHTMINGNDLSGNSTPSAGSFTVNANNM